jgi:hypothetical protein
MRSFPFTVLALVLACGAPEPTAPSLGRTVVAEQYIVTLKPGSRGHEIAAQYRGEILHTYRHALTGFAIRLPTQAAEALRRHPNVLRVEADERVAVDGATPHWNLDRIDQRSNTLNRFFQVSGGGAGVTAYVLDTGIRPTHALLTGRVLSGFTTFADGSTDDCHGHGTSVAGLIGGVGVGLATEVHLVPVRVMGCTGFGSWSDILAGMDWVYANAHRPAVANMSLGASSLEAVVEAVERSVASGIVYVASAGNDARDACLQSPANAPSAITVGAIAGNATTWHGLSNFGPCVDLLAPGSAESAGHTSDTDRSLIGGTSSAAAHASGAVARLLSVTPDATPASATTTLLAMATLDSVPNVPAATPNRLLYVEPNEPPGVLILGFQNANGIGTVTGGGLNCVVGLLGVTSGTCETTLPVSGLTLVGTPDATSSGPGWSACPQVVSGTCVVPGGTARAIAANFPARPAYVLTVLAQSLDGTDGRVTAATADTAGVTLDCTTAGGICQGAYRGTVTLTAAPGSGGELASWTGCTSANGLGCTVSLTSARTVTAAFRRVNAPPSAAFTASCAGLKCTFTNQSTDDLAVTRTTWSFGDGTTATTVNASRTYKKAGTYEVRLQVWDAANLTSAASRYVVVAR